MCSFGIQPAQKKAMQIVATKKGINQTAQIEQGLELYFQSQHMPLLKQYGFTLDEHSKIKETLIKCK